MDNGLIFPYPYGIVHAESAMLSSRVGPSGGSLLRTERVVGKPVERRKRAAVPGGGRPGVRA
jgi:hypothetical protein